MFAHLLEIFCNSLVHSVLVIDETSSQQIDRIFEIPCHHLLANSIETKIEMTDLRHVKNK
jgi:hypothetical protein